MRFLLVFPMMLAGLCAAAAQTTPPTTVAPSQLVPKPLPPVTSLPTRSLGGAPAIAQVLADGYEIKAAFINNGVSYVFLQKGPAAYMCKSGNGAACEKLN